MIKRFIILTHFHVSYKGKICGKIIHHTLGSKTARDELGLFNAPG